MRDLRGFARTDAGFNSNRQLVPRSDKKELKPLLEAEKGQRFSPSKINEAKLSRLRLEKQAHSMEMIEDQRRPYGSTAFNFQGMSN